MAIVATKTVTWVGDTPPQGTDRYSWVATWNSGGSGWVVATESTSDVWEFDVADWTTGNSGETRQVTFELRHYLISQYPNDGALTDSFTITQHAEATGA